MEPEAARATLLARGLDWAKTARQMN